MAKKTFTATRFGDWERATRRLQRLTSTAQEVKAAVTEEANKSADRVRVNIKRQNYEWQPLAESTLERKEREGKDLRTLIEDGEYINAIDAVSEPENNRWYVGVSSAARDEKGNSLAGLGLIHEYGLGHVPARPHWRKEYKTLQKRLKKHLIGLTGVRIKLK